MSASITTEMVQALRDETGVSVMQCKKALEEANGDMEQARTALRTIAAAQAEKKADRTLGAGVVSSYIHGNKKMGVLVTLSCETDFVAQNDEFIVAANQIAMHIGAMEPRTSEELLAQPFIMNPEITIQGLINDLIQKTGERVELGQFVRYTV